MKVFGYVNLTREVYGRMKGRGSGVIVNVIGVAGERNRSDYWWCSSPRRARPTSAGR